jgi:formate hydrogenlyase subunit 4
MDDPAIWQYGIPAVLLILAPFIGGLLTGIDRKLTARLPAAA